MVEQNALKWIQSCDTLEPVNLSLLRHLTLYQDGLVPLHEGLPLYHDPSWYIKMIVFHVSHIAQLTEYI